MNCPNSVIKALEPWLESARETLGTILNQTVAAGPLQTARVDRAELQAALPDEGLHFPFRLQGGLTQTVLLSLRQADAIRLVDMLSGGDGQGQLEELTGLHLDVLQETLQQLALPMTRPLSELLKKNVQGALSEPAQGSAPDQESSELSVWESPLQLSTEGAEGAVSLFLTFPQTLIETLARILEAPAPEAEAKTGGPRIEKPRFESMDPRRERSESSRLDTILEVPLKVTVVLGRTEVLLGDLVTLGEGSVLELDKLAGEPVELFVRDRLVAFGEVIVIDERFGVKILRLAEEKSPTYRSRL